MDSEVCTQTEGQAIAGHAGRRGRGLRFPLGRILLFNRHHVGRKDVGVLFLVGGVVFSPANNIHDISPSRFFLKNSKISENINPPLTNFLFFLFFLSHGVLGFVFVTGVLSFSGKFPPKKNGYVRYSPSIIRKTPNFLNAVKCLFGFFGIIYICFCVGMQGTRGKGVGKRDGEGRGKEKERKRGRVVMMCIHLFGKEGLGDKIS